MDAGHNIVDQRGRLLQRSYDVLGDLRIYAFILLTIELEFCTCIFE